MFHCMMEKAEERFSTAGDTCRKELSSLHFEPVWRPEKLWTQAAFIECCRFSADNKSLIFADSDGTIRNMHIDSQAVLEFSAGAETVWALDTSPDGAYICCCGGDRVVSVWCTRSMECLASHSCHTDTVWDVKFALGSQYIISCSSDLQIIIWDVKKNSEPIPVSTGHTRPISHIGVSHDGKSFASCSYDQTIRIWSDLTAASQGEVKCSTVLTGHRNRVTCCAFSPHRDDVVASGSADCDVILWSLRDRLALFRFKGHANIIWSCAFLRLKNELVLVSCSSDHSLRFWDTFTGHELATRKGFGLQEDIPAQLLCCQVSKDGGTIAVTTTDGCVYIGSFKQKIKND